MHWEPLRCLDRSQFRQWLLLAPSPVLQRAEAAPLVIGTGEDLENLTVLGIGRNSRHSWARGVSFAASRLRLVGTKSSRTERSLVRERLRCTLYCQALSRTKSIS